MAFLHAVNVGVCASVRVCVQSHLYLTHNSAFPSSGVFLDALVCNTTVLGLTCLLRNLL